jgi:hypothetical protein
MRKHAMVFLVGAAAMAACKSGSTTSFSQSYRNPGYEETVFGKIMVIGVAPDEEGRRAFEDALVSAIAAQGGTAVASIEVLPHEEQLTKEQLEETVAAQGYDAVLITRLLSVDKSTEYIPPKKVNHPQTRYYPGISGGYGYGYGYGYGGYYGYYGTTYAEVHTPDYFETSTTLKLETNLYSVATDELVWTGQSETVDPDSIDDARTSITNAVAQKLKAEGLIP